VNFEFFIVKKSIRGHRGEKTGKNSLVSISYIAIALSMIIMILSVSILTGFKKEIKDKLIGFGGQLQISKLDSNHSYEDDPISFNEQLVSQLRNVPQVASVYPYATKTAIVKSGKELQGIVLKGVDPDFDWSFFRDNLETGSIPLMNRTDTAQILISRSLASLLRIEVGQKLILYFIQDPPRMPRPFHVSGIYRTGLEEYDRLFVFCQISHIRDISGWQPDEINGYGLNLSDSRKMDAVADEVRRVCDQVSIETGKFLQVKTIQELAPGFFDFLSLTDTNVWVILALMILIAGFNMISGLLIIILNRTRMIGTLKALGADNRSVTRIFLYQALYVIGIGMILGNLIGLSLAFIQDRFALIPLNPESYFVDSVPILLNPAYLILLNAGTLILTMLMMLIPAGILTRISPDKTIKFD
jgi:lipoprotein-releasing system permease protein